MMEIVTSIAKWLVFDSIIGILIVAAAVYFVAAGIKRFVTKFPNPGVLAALVFFAGIFTVPSVPRYQFEKEALSQIEGKEWIGVINKTNWGSLMEPLTWFRAPVGSIFMVMPNSPIEEDRYREILLRYKKEPRIRISDTDCQERTIMYSEPDNEGVYRHTSEKAQPMTKQEINIYCEHDWSKEKEALRAEALKE